MKHYPFHVSDFRSATAHLTRLERSIYRDLLDMYYELEHSLPLEHVHHLSSSLDRWLLPRPSLVLLNLPRDSWLLETRQALLPRSLPDLQSLPLSLEPLLPLRQVCLSL